MVVSSINNSFVCYTRLSFNMQSSKSVCWNSNETISATAMKCFSTDAASNNVTLFEFIWHNTTTGLNEPCVFYDLTHWHAFTQNLLVIDFNMCAKVIPILHAS